jgi:glycosyltransferase involved in cell wall biosynthesis
MTISSFPCTVLLPIYNSRAFLLTSITNILATLSDFDELLIIDDGSEDLDADELKNISRIDSRINLISRPHLGLVHALNFGVREAANDLIARADVDDLYEPSRIFKQGNFLANNPEVSAVFSDYRIVNRQGRNLGTIPSAVTPELTKFSLINHQRTPHPSVMFRKWAVIDAGGYSLNAYPAEDLELWMRLADNSMIASIPETLLIYLKNDKGITALNNSRMNLKNQELRKTLIQSIEIERVLHEAETSLKNYEALNFSDYRKILFFRDLITYLTLSLNEFSIKRLNDLIKLSCHAKPHLIPGILKLGWEKRVRKRQTP